MNCPMSITKWEQKTETNSKKSTGRDKRYKENPRNEKFMICSFFPFGYLACYFKNRQALLPT